MSPFRVFSVAGLVVAAQPALAAAIYSDSLVFEVSDRQNSTGPGAAASAEETVRMTQSWNASSPTLGGIAQTSVLNPGWVAWYGCKETVNVFCGDEPTKYHTSRDGAEARVSTSGEAGFEVKARLDAGSIKPKVEYEVGLGPAGPVEKGASTYLNPTATLKSGEIGLRSPTASVAVDLVLGIEAALNGENCILGSCGTYRVDLPGVPQADREIISIDPNRIDFLDGFLPSGVDVNVPLSNVRADFRVGTVPPYFQVDLSNGISAPPLPGVSIDVANLEVAVPQFDEAGMLGADGVIRVSGQSNLLDARLDLDAMIPGLPTGGAEFGAGPFAVGVDAYDIEGGPSVDFFQDVQMSPDLAVMLEFDRPTFIEGVGERLQWFGDFLTMPAMIFEEVTTITPTFFASSVVKSVAGLQFGLELGIDLLKGNVEIGPLNYDFGPLANYPYSFNPNFLRASLFDSTFNVSAFNSIAGSPFTITPTTGAPLPVAAVPVPPGAPLLLAGCGVMAGLRRLRQRARAPAG